MPPVVISQVAVKPLQAGQVWKEPSPKDGESPQRPEAQMAFLVHPTYPANLDAVAPGMATPRAPATAPPPAAVEPALPLRPTIGERLATARTLAAAGEVIQARVILGEPALAGNGEAAYLLAETYDPNVLAALGLTGVKAEPERARDLYEHALREGVTAARQRVEALQ